ncbi:MAG: hypothetical protein SF028_09080 [Candidatus Sumerlaeia bacterium]|nr:hypothetical protein [Candidatus Sumerlaeia bacterium]
MRIAAASLLLAAAAAAADTTDTLRLEDVLNAPARTAERKARFDSLLIPAPDLELWERGATEPVPEWGLLPLPRLASRAIEPRGEASRRTAQAPLLIEGAAVDRDRADLRGRALLRISTATAELSMRYLFIDEATGAVALDLPHGPGMEETVSLPAGSYMVWRQIFEEGDRPRRYNERFPAQVLRGGAEYSASFDGRDEGALLRTVRRARPGDTAPWSEK